MTEQPPLAHHMSGSETMMWHIESDPWLSPNPGSITLFDRDLDFERFRRTITLAVSENERLRQKVVETGPLQAPRWEFDSELDLDWHLRHVGAPGNGSFGDLLAWSNQLFCDPYDRFRPLWQYWVVDGLADGTGALVVKLHHSVTDGLGGFRIAAAYTSLERDAADPAEVDLAEVLHADAERAERERAEDRGSEVADLVRLPFEIARRTAGVLLHPTQLGRAGSEVADLARAAVDQLHPAGSRLWAKRSGRRHIEALSLPFEDVHDAAKKLGGTVNDLFLAAAAEAGDRYHQHFDTSVDRFHITFVVSTRRKGEQTNAFTPVPLEVPAGTMAPSDRFRAIHELTGKRRSEVHGGGPMDAVSTIANLLPTPLVTGVVRNQAAHIDFATSNVPGFQGPSYVAGAQTLHSYGFGPVAGTAFNVTAVSIDEALDIGLNIDPIAVADPVLLRTCFEKSFGDLLEAA